MGEQKDITGSSFGLMRPVQTGGVLGILHKQGKKKKEKGGGEEKRFECV